MDDPAHRKRQSPGLTALLVVGPALTAIAMAMLIASAPGKSMTAGAAVLIVLSLILVAVNLWLGGVFGRRRGTEKGG